MSDLATLAFPFLKTVEKNFYVHSTCRQRAKGASRCGFLGLAAHMLSRALVQVEMEELKKNADNFVKAWKNLLTWLDSKKAIAVQGKMERESDAAWLGRGRAGARAVIEAASGLRPVLRDAHIAKCLRLKLVGGGDMAILTALDKIEEQCTMILEKDVSFDSGREKIVKALAKPDKAVGIAAGFLDKLAPRDFGEHVREVCGLYLTEGAFAGVEQDDFPKRLSQKVDDVVRSSGIWHKSFCR